MAYAVIEYDDEGNPKCEICGKHFRRVLSHVRQKHSFNEREYKINFGFDLKKGICSKESSEVSRQKVLENYDKCIGKNLILCGKNSRFVEGSVGRTKEKVSPQTKIFLTKRLKESHMIDAMKANGKKVGESGTGNKTRWNKKS